MNILQPLVLPSDIFILPVAQLGSRLRRRLKHDATDWSITWPGSRTYTSIVDEMGAKLLSMFKSPTTMVDAVIRFSVQESVSPQETLEASFEMLAEFINDGILMPASSLLAKPIEASLPSGAQFGAYAILDCVYAVVDTEVYLGKTRDGEFVALKMSRAEASANVNSGIVHEAAVLQRLQGQATTPRFIEAGTSSGRAFIVTSWCNGVDVLRATGERLHDRSVRTLWTRGELVARLIESYAALHAAGCLHGDPQPRNLLVDADGAVTILDFAQAWVVSVNGPLQRPRIGLSLFQEPEVAQARLRQLPSPSLNAAGEQYSVAALCYMLLTGSPTHEFSLEPDEMRRQLVEEPPRRFADVGVAGFSKVEGVLRRALSKNPAHRYASVDHLLAAFRPAFKADIRSCARRQVRVDRATRAEAHAVGEQLTDDVLLRLSTSGDLYKKGPPPPTASAMNGAAGFAYALRGIGVLRGDPKVIALADLWANRASADIPSPHAFTNPQLNIVAETFGTNSLYHHVAGVAAIEALVAHSRGDASAVNVATCAFVEAASAPCMHTDVAFGRAGLLLGCALLCDIQASQTEAQPVLVLGNQLRVSLWRSLEVGPCSGRSSMVALGAAHGWAGCLFAILRWSHSTSAPLLADTLERLNELASLGRPLGRGIAWPVSIGAECSESALGASWCNGAAGFIFLWTLAYSMTNDERFAKLAMGAGWTAFDAPKDASADLCCGLGGRAYGLLNLYRTVGEKSWLDRARCLAACASREVQKGALREDSLYKGDVGIALLNAALGAPKDARMPLYEGEGWPRRWSSDSKPLRGVTA
jgi:eukaryotic-like serine/threonine-protein kinase